MSAVTLTITGYDKTRQVELDPKGTIIGRSPECDIVLESIDVSRKHARIFQDPFGRWIIEDLGSYNGVIINGKRVEAYAVLPGESMVIGSFSLSIEPSLTQQIERDESVQMTSNIIEDDFHAEIVSGKIKADEILSHHYLKQLNEINERLSELRSSSELYPQVCRYLARGPKTVAAVLRLPESGKPLPESPVVLACQFGDDTDGSMNHDMTNLCLSRRTLQAVRSTGNAVMAKSTQSADAEMVLTISDTHNPRAVICAPLSAVTEVVDLLYLDVPVDQTTPDTFEFVRAVARQVISTRKSLIFMQVKTERQALDQQLSLAHDIQSKLTPKDLGSKFEVDVALCYKPAMWVGGDYCDVWSLENGQIAFAVGDVSGKGLPAALIMSNLQAALRTTMTFCTELSTVAEYVNRHLCHNLRDDMFVTFFLGLFDPSEDKLVYVNAGHVLPLIKRASESAQILGKATNPPLGIFEDSFKMVVETIQPDASLLVVTDGITEAGSPDGELFEMSHLVELVTDSKVCSAQDLVQSVLKGVTDFRHTMAQQDDITIFALVNRKIDKNV